MTEAEWRACEDPEPMLGLLRGEVYPGGYPVPVEGGPTRCVRRKVVLFTHAVCEGVPDSPLNRPTLRGMELLRRFAEGCLPLAELIPALEALPDAAGAEVNGDSFPFYQTRVDEPYGAYWIARKAAIVTAWHVAREAILRHDPDLIERRDQNWLTNELDLPAWQLAYRQARAEQAALLRDLVNYPPRIIALDPSRRTGSALPPARQIYDSRDFGAMPILSDALLDAGCDSADILNHCRGECPHVRGCWAVDLLLGKG